MATYYVDPVNGNNSNNGLGPDASHASNKPFLTIGKLIATSGVMVTGDIAYLAPGTFRETVTVAITSYTTETKLIGDPGNTQGFKTSGGVLVEAGDVRWSAFTTNDSTAPAANPPLDLAGRDFFTFQHITFVGGTHATYNIIRAETQTSINITFFQCAFIPSGQGTNSVSATNAANTALHWLFDSCSFVCLKGVNSISLTLTTHTANYDSDVIIKNCLFIAGSRGVLVTNSQTGGGSGGGVLVRNCTFVGQTTSAMSVTSTGNSQSVPCKLENSILLTPSATGVISGHTAQFTEDFNWISAATARSNVNVGGSSTADQSRALLVDIGQWAMNGQLPRPFFQPRAPSPLLGFGNGTGAPTVDFLQRPRPSGGASTSAAIGYVERHDFGVRESTVVDASTYALKLTGPGDHDILIPVDASATVITIKTRFDTNHATTNRPQAILLAHTGIGVATETKTATVAVDTWEVLTFSSITPTAKGFVTLRLVSRSAAATGIAYWDTLTVS